MERPYAVVNDMLLILGGFNNLINICRSILAMFDLKDLDLSTIYSGSQDIGDNI